MPGTDLHTLLALSLRVACIGVLLRSASLLMNWREMADKRLLGWNPEARVRKALAWRLRPLLCSPGGLLLLALQATAAGAGLFAGFEPRAALWVAATLFALQAWYNYRFAIVYQAADTMFLIVFGAVFAAALAPAELRLQQAALAFLGLHVLLAYALSGRSKVTSSAWRDGSHLVEILRRSTCRMEPCGRWLERRPGLARALARGVIALELLLPLAVLAPRPVLAAMLAGGILFHAGVAVVMGMPGFFWAFVAAYPALWFLQQAIHTAF